ncbi:MAG: hypothetical protein LBF90_03925 [Prevotellaceae bacterium]|nr:hypothetical protein [Prevotellaceae bacterium]
MFLENPSPIGKCAPRPTLDTRRSTLDARRAMLDGRRSTLDVSTFFSPLTGNALRSGQ